MGDRQIPNHDLKGYVKSADYSAQSVLVAVADDTPAAVTVPAGSVIGRATGGNAGALALPAVTLDADTVTGSTPPTIRALGAAVGPSAGYYSGLACSQAGSSEPIDVSAGAGQIRTTDSASGAIVQFTYAGSSINYWDLKDNACNYICVEYSAGAVSIGVTDDPTDINGRTVFAIALAWRKSTDVYLVQCGPQLNDSAGRELDRGVASGPQRISGGAVSGTRRGIVIAESAWLHWGADLAFAAANSSITNFEHYFYDSGSGTWSEPAATGDLSNTQYNTGGALVSLTTGYYCPHWIYLSLLGGIVAVYGQAEYSTLAAALAAAPPTTLPDYVSDFCIYIGRAIAQQGNVSLLARETTYQDPMIRVANTLDHANLAGLQGGSASERYHLSVVQVRDLLSEVQTTADDTTTKLNASNYRRQILTGSGIMQAFNLGNTANYRVAREFEFENKTFEYVLVRSNHATAKSAALWQLIPPLGRLICTCIDPTATGGASGGEKEGTWASHLIEGPAAFGITEFDDFDSTRYASDHFYGRICLTGAKSGTGASLANANSASRFATGIIELQSGTAVAAYTSVSNQQDFRTGFNAPSGAAGGAIRSQWRLNVSALASSAEDYTIRLGMGDTLTGGAHTQGLFVKYNSSSGYYMIKAINASGTNELTTSIVPVIDVSDSVWDTVDLILASANGRADAFINREQVTPSGGLGMGGTIYMPTYSAVLYHIASMYKEAGTTEQVMHIDWLRKAKHYVTERV